MHITRKILCVTYSTLCIYCDLHVNMPFHTEDSVFVELLDIFIVLFQNNGSVFCHFVRNSQEEITQVSGTQLGLEPHPTQPRAHVRVTHSHLVCLFASLIHTYLHTCHTVPQPTASTQNFAGTVEILYHSNTIAILPTD